MDPDPLAAKPEDDKPLTGPWRKVDPAIWALGRPPTRLGRFIEKLTGLIRFSSFWIVVFGTPLFVLISFMAAYSLVGAAFFGPVVLSLWGGFAVGFIVLMEKTGYARNFEDKTFKLSPARILAIPLAFLMILAGFYFLLFIGHKL